MTDKINQLSPTFFDTFDAEAAFRCYTFGAYGCGLLLERNGFLAEAIHHLPTKTTAGLKQNQAWFWVKRRLVFNETTLGF